MNFDRSSRKHCAVPGNPLKTAHSIVPTRSQYPARVCMSRANAWRVPKVDTTRVVFNSRASAPNRVPPTLAFTARFRGGARRAVPGSASMPRASLHRAYGPRHDWAQTPTPTRKQSSEMCMGCRDDRGVGWPSDDCPVQPSPSFDKFIASGIAARARLHCPPNAEPPWQRNPAKPPPL